MNTFKKHWKTIVIISLGLLLFFKSCQSCSRKQAYQFCEYELQNTTDSLNIVINTQNDSIEHLNTELQIALTELSASKKENANLIEDKKHLKNINSKLASKKQ